MDEEEPTNLQQHMHTMQSLCHTPTSNVCKGQPTQLEGKNTTQTLQLANCCWHTANPPPPASTLQLLHHHRLLAVWKQG